MDKWQIREASAAEAERREAERREADELAAAKVRARLDGADEVADEQPADEGAPTPTRRRRKPAA